MYSCVVLTNRYAQQQQARCVARSWRHLSNDIKLNCFYPVYTYLRAFWFKYTPEKSATILLIDTCTAKKRISLILLVI